MGPSLSYKTNYCVAIAKLKTHENSKLIHQRQAVLVLSLEKVYLANIFNI